MSARGRGAPLRVAVLGGGITGLSAARRTLELARARGVAAELRVYEKQNRAGGLIRTDRVDDATIEAGADSFVTKKPAALELCRALGLTERLRPLDGPDSRTCVLHRGRPRPLPDGCTMFGPTRLRPVLTSRLFSMGAKARIALEPWIPLGSSGADESLGSFFSRRLGRAFVDRVTEPVVAGIHTADVDALSVEMTLPQLAASVRRDRSLIATLRKMRAARSENGPALVTLQGGMSELTRALVSELPAGSLQLDERIDGLSWSGPGSSFRLRVGDTFREADIVVSSLPAGSIGPLVAPLDRELADALGGLSYASCATATIFYERSTVQLPEDGYGFFVPREAGLPILACSYVSRKFPDRTPPGLSTLRVYLGGALHGATLDRDDERLVWLAHSALRGPLGLSSTPTAWTVHRFPEAMPQYPVGYRATVQRIEERTRDLPGLVLCGSPVGAVGLPDCIASGRKAAEQAFEERAPAVQRRLPLAAGRSG